MKIENEKLLAIITRAQADLAAFVAESEDKILDAWSAAEKEAQENDTKPVFRIAFNIALDDDANNMATALSFAVRHKLSRDGEMPTPEQLELQQA